MITVVDTGPLLALAKVQALALAAEANFAAAGCATRVKGTLGAVVSATQQALLDKTEAIALITSLKTRPDVWLNAALCDQVIHVLEAC